MVIYPSAHQYPSTYAISGDQTRKNVTMRATRLMAILQ